MKTYLFSGLFFQQTEFYQMVPAAAIFFLTGGWCFGAMLRRTMTSITNLFVNLRLRFPYHMPAMANIVKVGCKYSQQNKCF